MSTPNVSVCNASHWTPEDRDEWILFARNSNKERGNKRGYSYNTMSKQLNIVNDVEDIKRTLVTSCLAKSIYEYNPIMKRLSFCFYKSLMQKMYSNSFLVTMYNHYNFVILIKGSNAYKLLLKKLASEIEYSDLDIIIYINPYLEQQLYEQIRSSIHILVCQVMSRYKKDLDSTLFGMSENTILRQDLVAEFKEKYNNTLSSMQDDNGIEGKILSPFQDTIIRNECSKKSFMILEHETNADNIIRIEVPHFEKCEFIPLKKSPLVVSCNNTISFDRDTEGIYKGAFDLIRMRLNNLYVFGEDAENYIIIDKISDVESDVGSSMSSTCSNSESQSIRMVRHKIIPADFIDVSIPHKHDAELLDFWKTCGIKRCYEIYDRFIGANIMIPNVNECIRDLSNILNVYNNGQIKVEKRQRRLELFKHLDEIRKSWKENTTHVTTHVADNTENTET
jgi:hypothetical protein